MTDEQNVEEPNATPAAVEHAEEVGVDLSNVEGSGAEGRITKADVAAAAEESPVALTDRDLAANKMPASRLASESGDPQVHQLIAQREAHAMNLQGLQPNESQLKYHQEQIDAIDQQLRDLGYKV